MFIAFIGLKNAGIITANADTFVQLGKFTPVSILGLISILLCGCLMARRVKGSPVRRHHHLYLDRYSDGRNPVL